MLGQTWHSTYKELPCAGRISYQWTSRYGLPPCTMQEPCCLQLQRGKDLHLTAEEVHATRTKEEEMVWELLNGWQKGAHGYIPEVKDDNIIRLGCENVNSLSIFTQPNQRCANSPTYIKGIKQTGPALWNTVLTSRWQQQAPARTTYSRECTAAGSLPVTTYTSCITAINKAGQ